MAGAISDKPGGGNGDAAHRPPTRSHAARLPVAIDLSTWRADTLQLMEESHLCAFSRDAASRAGFLDALAPFLGSLGDTQVSVLRGRLNSFCAQLENALGCQRIRRRIDGPLGVIEALRTRPSWSIDEPENGAPPHPTARPIRRRFILWEDADLLLNRDAALFSLLVDAIMGVAAECEYTGDDLLLIQRAVFLGGPALDVYAEQEDGQFKSWAHGPRSRPRWKSLTKQSGPRVYRYTIAKGGCGEVRENTRAEHATGHSSRPR
jgi:hypothetical protein